VKKPNTKHNTKVVIAHCSNVHKHYYILYSD